MPSGWVRSDFVEWAVVLIVTWFVLRRSTSDRWQRRLGAIRSPLLGSPTYRVLFLLVAIGLLLITVLPEAAFVLPAVDAVGLDIVTIFAALELRHYVSAVARRDTGRRTPVLRFSAATRSGASGGCSRQA